MCVEVSEDEFEDFHFLCPPDYVFDQKNLVCANWFEVDCQQSAYYLPGEFTATEDDDRAMRQLAQPQSRPLFSMPLQGSNLVR